MPDIRNNYRTRCDYPQNIEGSGSGCRLGWLMNIEHTSNLHLHPSRPGYLAELTLALLFIHDTQASGRLSLRNGERFGIAHLYFHEARLIHVTGDKCDGESILQDLLSWSKGSVRFDAGMLVQFESITWQQAQVFGRWLAFLEMRGIMQGIAHSRLNGLARRLTARLPGKPIALPDEIEHYEEHEEAALARRWQRINEGVQQLIGRTINREARQKVSQSVQETIESVKQTVGQNVERAISRAASPLSPLPPELQALSVRPGRAYTYPTPATPTTLATVSPGERK